MSNESNIRMLPEQGERVETGAIQFGTDWPGTFIRGDNGIGYMLALNGIISGNPGPFDMMQVESLRDLLGGSIVGPSQEILAKLVPYGERKP